MQVSSHDVNPMYLLWQYPAIGWMKIYFLMALIGAPVFLFLLWKSNSKNNYRMLHNLLEFLIFAGIFSLMLIYTNVIIKQLLNI